MRVYIDNCIVSGEIRGDLVVSEQTAIAELRKLETDASMHESGDLLRSSRNSNDQR